MEASVSSCWRSRLSFLNQGDGERLSLLRSVIPAARHLSCLHEFPSAVALCRGRFPFSFCKTSFSA